MLLKKLFRSKKSPVIQSRFDPEHFPAILNLGCGLDIRPDCLNIDLNDFHNPDLVCDVSDLRLLPTAYYQHIIARDILEHVERPKIPNTLKGWNRVLRPGGTLEFQVPSASGLLTLLEKPENQSCDMHHTLLQCMFGTQTYEGDYHHFAFTDLVLKTLFETTGFSVVHLETVHEWLFRGSCKKIRDVHVDPMFFLSDNAFLVELYRTLLNRDADPEGRRFYLAMLKNGISREAVAEAVRNSPEYKGISVKTSHSRL